MLSGILVQRPLAKCDWSRGALDAGAAFVGRQEFGIDTREPVQIWMVRAGNRIPISGTGIGSGALARVSVTVKMAETCDTFSLLARGVGNGVTKRPLAFTMKRRRAGQ